MSSFAFVLGIAKKIESGLSNVLQSIGAEIPSSLLFHITRTTDEKNDKSPKRYFLGKETSYYTVKSIMCLRSNGIFLRNKRFLLRTPSTSRSFL